MIAFASSKALGYVHIRLPLVMLALALTTSLSPRVEARLLSDGAAEAAGSERSNIENYQMAQEALPDERVDPAPAPHPAPPADRSEPDDGGQGDLKFPVVFKSQNVLQQTGIVIKDYGKFEESVRHFRNKCYLHSDDQHDEGVYDISVSDAFLSKFKKRGFSLNSLCLALNSGIRFDPQTGVRLPTFILADPDPENVDETTNETPFDVPNCFRNGHPYSDCAMKFDPMTGRDIGNARREQYAEVGRLIEAQVKARQRQGLGSIRCSDVPQECSGAEACEAQRLQEENCSQETNDDGWLRAEENLDTFEAGFEAGPSGETPVEWQMQRMLDVSHKLKDGFGYSLYKASGGGGTEPTDEAKVISQEGTRVVTSGKIGILSRILDLFRS